MFIDRIATSLLAISISIALAQHAAAQDVVSPEQNPTTVGENQIAEIVVTAQKRTQKINDVGMSISALGTTELQARGIDSVADLVKAVPGFNYTPSNYGAPVYTLRGVGFFDTSLGSTPAVSVYVDEVPLPITLMTIGATLDVERVEVLKGPQGTLFGQNSTGGAVNYIAAKPTSELSAGVNLTYGRFNRTEVNGFISGPLSDTLRVRVAGRWDRQDDWQYTYTRNETRGRSSLAIGRMLVDWEPTDKLKVALNVNGWQDRSDNPAAQLVAVINPSPRVAPALRTYTLPPEDNRAADWDVGGSFRRNVKFWQASGRIDYELSDSVQITSLTSYGDLRRDSITDTDGTAVQNFIVLTPGSAENFSQELRVSGDVGRMQYIVGANYAYEKVLDEASTINVEASSPFRTGDLNTSQKAKTWAVFGNAEWEVSDGLTLQGGMRYTNQRRDFSGCSSDSGDGTLAALISPVATRLSGQTVVIPPGACVTLGPDFLPGLYSTSLKEDNLAWRGSVNWKPNSETLLYANISRGYKNGNFPTLGATFFNSYQPATQEAVLAYEAGTKLTLLDRTLQLNAALFYYDYDDKQFRGKTFVDIIGPQNSLVNIPKSRIYGSEVQIDWKPLAGLTVNLGGTYINSKIGGDFSNFDALAQPGNFSGESFPLVPKWQTTGDIQYEHDLSDEAEAFIGVSFNHQSMTNAGLGEIPIFDIDAYTLLDARLGVRLAHSALTVTGFVRNLTNKYYWNQVFLAGPDVVTKYTGQPRTFGVRVSYRY